LGGGGGKNTIIFSQLLTLSAIEKGVKNSGRRLGMKDGGGNGLSIKGRLELLGPTSELE